MYQIHYIKELVKNYKIEFELCRSKDQVANTFIKLLKMDMFKKLKMMFSVIDLTTQFKGEC